MKYLLHESMKVYIYFNQKHQRLLYLYKYYLYTFVSFNFWN